MASSEKKVKLQSKDDGHSGERREVRAHDTPFNHKSWKSDLTVVVEGKELYVSKVILASLSPVFDRMFGSEFKEKTTNRLTLPDKGYESFLEFVCCIYPGVDKPITNANIELIIPLLHEYQIDSFTNICENLLLEAVGRDSDIDQLYSSLTLAVNYQLKKLKDRCVEIASERDIADLLRGKQDYELPSDVHEEILTFAVKRLQLDVKDYRALANARGFDPSYIPPGIRVLIPDNSRSGTFSYYSYHSYKSDYPRDQPMDFANRIALITSLRFSIKAGNTSQVKLLLKICKDRPSEEMKEIENEDIMKYLPSDLKDFILGKKSTLPSGILENDDED